MARRSTGSFWKVLATSFLSAFVLMIFGDMLTYDPATLGANETAIGFEEGSTYAELIDVAPSLVIVLGVYGATQYM